MTYKPDFTIDLPGGKVCLLFNAWTFRQYCMTIGIEFEDLLTLIQEGRAFRSKDLPGLLLVSAESYCMFNNIPFTYTEKDSYVWIDDVGGFNSSKFIGLYKAFISKLLNVSPEQFEVIYQKAAGEEGKPEPPKKKKAVRK